MPDTTDSDAPRGIPAISSWRPIHFVAVAIALVTIVFVMARWWYPFVSRPAEMKFIWMADLGVYRMGGNAVVHGLPLYELKANAGPTPDMLPFTYTPFAAMIFVLVAALSAGLSELLWTVGNIVGIGFAVWWALGMMGVRRPRTRILAAVGGTVVAHLLDPVVITLLGGQINVLIMVLVLLAFPVGGPRPWRGIALGIAAGIKLTPLIFIVHLLLVKRWRTALEAIATFLATVAVGFLALPGHARQYWFDGVFADTERVLILPIAVNNSLPGLLGRLTQTMNAPLWALPVWLGLGVLGLLAARRVARQGHELLGILVAAFTGLIFSPVSWPAHAVWFVPAFVWLALARWRTGTVLPRAVLVLTIAWVATPIHHLAEKFVGGTPYPWTVAGKLLATLGSTLPVMVVGLATILIWSTRLRPPASGSAAREPVTTGSAGATVPGVRLNRAA